MSGADRFPGSHSIQDVQVRMYSLAVFILVITARSRLVNVKFTENKTCRSYLGPGPPVMAVHIAAYLFCTACILFLQKQVIAARIAISGDVDSRPNDGLQRGQLGLCLS